MKSDNQHLEFLISQYVDGCLEGGNKKMVEQHLLADPAVRDLYSEHRDVQDLLDDWGNRIPLIDWDRFDQTVAARLEKEQTAHRSGYFGRWFRPVAAAAALLVAAGAGYLWHGWSAPSRDSAPTIAKTDFSAGHTVVQFPDNGAVNQWSRSHHISVEEPSAPASDQRLVVTISPPSDSAASESLRESLRFGLGNLAPSAQPQAPVANTVAAVPATRKETTEPLPAYP